jgi:lipopolysaccharide export system protein LptC
MKGTPTGRLRVWATVAIVAAVALTSLWVAEVMRQRTDDVLPDAARTEPDYYVDRFEFVQMGAAGMPQYTLSGAKMRHYPADDSSVVDKPVIRSVAADEPPMTVVADSARVSEDNTKVHMYDNVLLNRPATATEEQLRVITDYALVLPDEDIVKTDKPVTIIRGKSVLRGNGMIANNATRQLELTGNVRGTYIAPAQ